jgi:hypothetical protein
MLLARLRVVLIALTLLPPAAHGARADALAGVVPWQWLGETTAHALKAAEPGNDLRVGGLEALNRSVRSSLHGVDELVPPWLRRVDLDLSFQGDLSPKYRLSTTQPLYRTRATAEVIEVLGRLERDPAGRTAGQVGLGYRRPHAAAPFSMIVRGTLADEQPEARQRYGLGTELGWPLLVLRGELENEVPVHAAAPVSERLLDRYEIEAVVSVPDLDWARLHATHFRHLAPAPYQEDGRGERYRVVLQPWAPLALETGTSHEGGGERAWFAQVRLKLALGGA